MTLRIGIGKTCDTILHSVHPNLERKGGRNEVFT